MNSRAGQRLEQELIGRVVGGRFELTRRLAFGGMGAVYEARNTSTLKRCAVKLLLSSEVEPDSAEVKRFIMESRSSSAVESEHIVNVFDAGIDPDSRAPYIVMELLRGEDLRALLKRLQVLPPELVARLALQAATGLGRAHASGVVHRDVKPANLFLTQRDNGEHLLKIVDFGIAKVRTGGAFESQETLTQDGHVLGTPAYMSPEQARGERDAGADADVWSLGVVMFELLTGRLPYSHTSPLATLMTAIATEPLPSVRRVAPWVPEGLARIVERATARDVRERYRDANELLDALNAFCENDGRVTRSLLRSLSDEEKQASLGAAPPLKPYLGDDERVTRNLPATAATPSAALASPALRRSRLALFALLPLGVAIASYLVRARSGGSPAVVPRAASAAASVPMPSANPATTATSPSAAVTPVVASPPRARPPAPPATRRPAGAALPAARSAIDKGSPAAASSAAAPRASVRQRAQLSDAVDEFR